MSRPDASRRQLVGAGAALLLLAPAAIGTTKAAEIDGKLLRLCADLERWDRKRQQRDREFQAGIDHTEEETDAVLGPWWDAVDAIAATPARTPEGIRAKADAARRGIIGCFGDERQQVTVLVASLLTDMLGKPVRLPGMEDGA
jgi:hypothetical protein